MNMQRIVTAAACAGFGAHALASGVNLYSQDFESANNAEYTMSLQGDGTLNHFMRTNVAVNLPFYEYHNSSGTFVSGLDDLFEGSDRMVTTRSIDITNMANLQFAVDLAAGNFLAGNYVNNSLALEYQIDGGMWTSMMSVDPLAGSAVIYGSNEPDGTPITSTFSTFSTGIADIGSAMTIRATWRGGFTFDYIGLDNILVTGDNSIVVVPVPPAAFAGLAMLAGLGAYRRVRK